MKYFSVFVTGQMGAAAEETYFGNFTGELVEPIGWFFLFMGITAVIVFFGVEKGIEKASRFMMPALVVLTIGVTAFVLFQPGAMGRRGILLHA